jgi:hypothetical protein
LDFVVDGRENPFLEEPLQRIGSLARQPRTKPKSTLLCGTDCEWKNGVGIGGFHLTQLLEEGVGK